MPTRRCLLTHLLLLSGGGVQAAPVSLLDRAIARAGGAQALRRAKVLRWTGWAKVFAGDQVILIGVSTRVAPFKSARSDTWLLSDGPGRPRSLIVDGDEAWVERNRQRLPLSAAQAHHEKAQYALYGLMLLSPLRDPGVRLDIDESRREIAVEYPGAPVTTLRFEPDGRLAGARNTVPSPDKTDATIAQDIRFEGEVHGGGIRWPRRLSIVQDGKPYFELTLETFSVSPQA